MTSNLKIHAFKLIVLILCADIGLLLYLAAGEIKPWPEIVWMDVLGEGGSMLFVLLWLVMLLAARPGGRITDFLAAGLGCLFFSLWMEVLDEFIRMPSTVTWDNWLESAPMPVGLLLITIGIYYWHQEQVAISAQMEKRERLFREHRLYDSLTPLARAEYLRQQLKLSLRQAQRDQEPLSLIAVDLDDFHGIIQRYGMAEGDAVLLAVSQLLILNLRRQDLLCRLAGDRFAVLLPNTGEAQAWKIAGELRDAVAALSHRTHQHGERLQLRASVSAAMAMAEEDDAESLLERLNRTFLQHFQPLPATA